VEINKKTWRNIFLCAGGCVVLYWILHETGRMQALFNTIGGIFAPFIIGAVLAFILNVPMRAIERLLKGVKKQGARRALAILLTMLAVLLVVAGVFYLLVPQIIDTVKSLIETLPGFFNRVKDSVVAYLNEHPEQLEWLNENTDFETINWSEMIQKLLGWITARAEDMINGIIGAVIELSNGIFDGVLSLVFCLYCLSRKEILARQGRRLLYAFLPEKTCDEIIRVLRMSNSVFSNFISGQCLEAVILGAMFAVSMSIFRMPYMPLVSVVIAVTALVPIVGAFVGCVLGAFFILVGNPVLAFWFVVMFLILQQIEGNLIYPRVVGTSIGLPGMWVLVAVAVGGDLMGVGGMLLMIPLASVLYALVREFTNKRLEERGIDREKLQDQPPELRSGFKENRQKRKDKKQKQEALKKEQKENCHKKENP